jgi:protein-L-isoaspartate(D-aspartate) O-methyltransferase
VGSLDTMRRFYARFVTADIDDPRLTEAFAAMPRETFVGPGPWKIRVEGGYLDTETDDPVVLYQDILVALSQRAAHPSREVLCRRRAEPWRAGHTRRSRNRILHGDPRPSRRPGGTSGSVRVARGHGSARHRESGRLPCRDGASTVSSGAADTCRGCDVHQCRCHWSAVDLARRAVSRWTAGPANDTRRPTWRHVGNHTAYAARTFGTVGFIPCIGARDDAEAQALRTALETRPAEDVRSLRRDSVPDETAWLVGSGWWLSTKSAESSQ